MPVNPRWVWPKKAEKPWKSDCSHWAKGWLWHWAQSSRRPRNARVTRPASRTGSGWFLLSGWMVTLTKVVANFFHRRDRAHEAQREAAGDGEIGRGRRFSQVFLGPLLAEGGVDAIDGCLEVRIAMRGGVVRGDLLAFAGREQVCAKRDDSAA